MPKNQKDKKDGTVEEDQKERGYYYDDAHGYEEFDPEKDEEEDRSSERSPESPPTELGQATEAHLKTVRRL